VCLSRWTTADFLTSVTDRHERHMEHGWESRMPRTADEFGRVFLSGTAHMKNLEDIASFESSLVERARGERTIVSFRARVLACTSRQLKIMFRERLSWSVKWAGMAHHHRPERYHWESFLPPSCQCSRNLPLW